MDLTCAGCGALPLGLSPGDAPAPTSDPSADVVAWASRHPDEIPLINDEVPWIAATLADLE